MSLHVCVVGGIFDKPAAYRETHRHSPETTLADGLAALGQHVVQVGHRDFAPSDAFDVVHVHHVGRAAYVMATARTRARFVFTGHNGQVLCGYERNPVRRWAFHQVVRSADAFVALSLAEARFIAAADAGIRVEVIPNGIVGARGTCDPAPTSRSGLLFVGQLIPLKGVDILLRAFAMLREAEGTTLSLAYQNDQLERPLRSLARRLGIARRVRFLGPLPRDPLARLYSSVAAVVLPSHAESLPSVVSEALLAGTPVVASRIGGIPEQLDGFGELVRPGDAAELAAALQRVLRRPPSEAERKAAVERARARFDPDAMVRAHDQLYRSLMEAERPKRGVMAGVASGALLRFYPRRARPRSRAPGRVSD